MPRSRRFWIPTLLIVALLAGGSVLLLPPLRRSWVAANERNASVALKMILSAEAEFRAQDRDGNQVQDFWTGDVSGLYAVSLIPRELAEADAEPLKPLVPSPVPYQGYLFRALDHDRTVQDSAESVYRQDSGGKPGMGKVHNTSRFGFIAYPARFGETGRFTFSVNEIGSVVRLAEDGSGVRDWPVYVKPAPTRTLEIADAQRQLPRTTVTAHLLERHVAGRNLLWCATAQVAWDDLEGVLKFPLELKGNPEMAVALQRKLVGRAALPPGKFVAAAGFFRDGIVEKIAREMKEKFPRAMVPEFAPGTDDEALSFCYLFTDLPFRAPLFRHKKGIAFAGKPVTAFGLWDAHSQKPSLDQLRQVTVRDFVSDTDFVVELDSNVAGERILVARLKPGETLHDTVTAVMRRSRKGEDALSVADDLMIPCINFDLRRTFTEVMGPERGFVRSLGWIREGRQQIKFRFDEEGATLESLAHFWTVLNGEPPKGRKMICDGPFLILLARRGSELPYFAFWVENEELLVR